MVPIHFHGFHYHLIVINLKCITAALHCGFVCAATSECVHLDTPKPPHIWHAPNLTHLPTPLPTQTCSPSRLSPSQWMVLLHPHNCPRLGSHQHSFLSLAQITPQSQWLPHPQSFSTATTPFYPPGQHSSLGPHPLSPAWLNCTFLMDCLASLPAPPLPSSVSPEEC